MEYRYERKYFLENFSQHLVTQSVVLHPASFKKAFPDRWINNIYFDTPDLIAYHDNVAGVSNRRKYRVRWYGEDPIVISNPKLEIKVKDNQLGSKIINRVPEFKLDFLGEITNTVGKLSGTFLPLYPVLMNSYLRSYYVTPDGKFRVTIDRGMRYFSILKNSTFRSYRIFDNGAILELKYGKEEDEKTDRITQFLPYRQTKSSKYVTGVELTI